MGSTAALSVAISQIGQDEKPHGSNWGHPVQDYLASVYITFPASWCMAFVYWCYQQVRLKAIPMVVNPLSPTGGVLHQLALTQPEHVMFTPTPGDIFIMDFGHGLGHTGFVERVDENFIYTVEGNTNDTGSREGIEVCRRKRARASIKCYLSF